MRTSLAFGLFLMVFLIAEVACRTPSGHGTLNGRQTDGHNNAQDSGEIMKEANEEDANEEDEDEFDDQENEETEGPLLTCTLFNDNAACNAMCSIMSSIYSEPASSGTCTEQYCNCNLPPNAILEDFWKQKFDSPEILQEILKNDDLSSKILDVLRTPYQTPQQTKQDLESLLTPKQIEDLQVKNKDTQKLFTEDGAADTVAVQKYVTEKLKSLQTPLAAKDYKKLLLKSLDNADEDTFDHILHTIRRSKNKLLNDVLDKYVSDHDIEESPIQTDEEDSMVDILDTAIINAIIKPAPCKTQPGGRGKSSPRSPSSRSKSTKSKENIPKKPNSTSNSSGKTSANDKHIDIDKNLYTLNGFDKTQVARFKQGVKGNKYWDKCWSEPNAYEVCTTRYSYAELFSWSNKKRRIEVQMRKFTNGNVGQTWKFLGCGFELQRKADGKILQYWDLPNGSHWEYIKSPDGEISQHWRGDEDWGSVEYYKTFMDLWCAENGSYYNVGGEPCIMY